MAWDPAAHVVVLYGGLVTDSLEGHEVGETWTWNGSDWTEVDAGPGPPDVRQGLSMITAGGQVLLYGGNVGNVVYYEDAWSWAASSWTRVDQAPRPQGRGGAAVAWNASTATMLVYGGIGLNQAGGPGALGVPLSDGWALHGGAWSRLSAGGPGQLEFANAVWSGTRFTVLLGMQCPHPSDAAWTWDGNKWSPSVKPGIPARWGAAVAQAPDGTGLLFGGSNAPGC